VSNLAMELFFVVATGDTCQIQTNDVRMLTDVKAPAEYMDQLEDDSHRDRLQSIQSRR